jgi:RimJ/RimL family protein N-acetyltransferase
MKPVVLQTPRLVLDQPTLDDVETIVTYCQDPVFETVLTTPWPYTRANGLEYVTEFVPNGWKLDVEYGWALRLHGRYLGAASFRTRGDIGFWIGAAHRGNGYMTEAVDGILDWVFSTGVQRVVWECLVGNTQSASVARKAGFSYRGEYDSSHVHRDGRPRAAWHGEISASDSREAQPGWPAAKPPA